MGIMVVTILTVSSERVAVMGLRACNSPFQMTPYSNVLESLNIPCTCQKSSKLQTVFLFVGPFLGGLRVLAETED